jgi:hypothetical protein
LLTQLATPSSAKSLKQNFIQKESIMKAKAIAAGLIFVSFYWVYAAIESYARGKTGICVMQGAAAMGFAGRGIFEWLKANRS